MSWIALTLQVDAGAAEAMSEALVDAGAQSVCIDQPDFARPTLQALITEGEDARALVDAAARAAGLASSFPFTAVPVADQDWVRRTQAEFAPIEIGARLWVGPSWHQPPRERVAVRIDPGLAFGTGSHPTTQLVLNFLDKVIWGGERVLDYGCGSGVLALAAAKLGAAQVDGADADPQAVETALANARVNRVELRAWLPDGLPDGLYDIVVSNILAQPLIVLAPLLAARTRPGGRLALAGILQSQAEPVARAYDPWFHTEVTDVRDGWALLCGRRQ